MELPGPYRAFVGTTQPDGIGQRPSCDPTPGKSAFFRDPATTAFGSDTDMRLSRLVPFAAQTPRHDQATRTHLGSLCAVLATVPGTRGWQTP